MIKNRLLGLSAERVRFAAILAFAISLAIFVSNAVNYTPATADANFYTTNFPNTENPISENGQWTNGQDTGVDWSDIVTTPGFAHGTQTGSDGYNDSIAVLTGTWNADQYVRAVVHTVNQSNDDSFSQEVELLLRFAVTPHSAQGYEINFRCSGVTGYTEIVRWNGPLGDFTYVQQQSGPEFGVQDGDVIEATIVGNRITVYKNGIEVNRGTDNTYTAGNPGVGFFNSRATSARNGDFGFTSYTASNNPIDATAPDTTITSSPGNPSNSTSARFSFTATKAGSSFECKLDAGSFTACTSPQTYTGLTIGSHTFRVRATDTAGNTDPTPASFSWMIDTAAPLSLSALTLPGAEVNVSYSAPLVTGGHAPYIFQPLNGTIPAGLNPDPATGRLIGIPSLAKRGSFRVQITDQLNSSVTGTFMITISSALRVSTTALKAGTQGKTYKGALAGTGGKKPHSWSLAAGSLPSGLNLNLSTGALTGTTMLTGSFPVTFRVSDDLGGQQQRDFTLTIK